MKKITTDYLIVGAGLAGLYTALQASEKGNVTVITKTKRTNSNSYLAQGGIAAVLSEEDKVEFHIKDTLKAGAGICNRNNVKLLVEDGIIEVKELIELGMRFDTDQNQLSLGLEGGHSKRRVLHAQGNSTGQAIVDFILNEITKKKNITIYEDVHLHKLLTKEDKVIGVKTFFYDKKETILFLSKYTVIASGGYAGVYSRTTNPKTTTGDGIVLAYNAGAVLSDLEFIQFHPTAFYSESGRAFLISEAVRGEGAFLVNSDQERFMPGKHELAELAPRDVVSKEIFDQINLTANKCVYLDLRHLDPKKIVNRFPNIYKGCLEYGIDITQDLIPVSPAAHFTIGGIKTNINGETNLKNLFACGEAANVYIHGANRLASNSLLSCVVFAKRIINATNPTIKEFEKYEDNEELYFDEIKAQSNLKLRNHMALEINSKVGIIRDKESLEKALSFIEESERDLMVEPNEISSNSLLLMSSLLKLVVKSALMRKESRGTHKRKDYPGNEKSFEGHFLVSKDKGFEFEKLSE